VDTRLLFMLLLAAGYVAVNAAVTAWYRRSFHRDDNFLGSRASDSVQRFFGRAVPGVMAYYAVLVLSLVLGTDLAGLVSYVRPLDSLPVQLTGLVLGIVSLAMMALVRFNLGSAWRVGLDHDTQDALVTTGFYRYVRNPYFSFLLCLLASLCLVAPSAIAFCAFIQTAMLLALQVRQEETFLSQKYGPEYAAYLLTTGRFLPHLAGKKGQGQAAAGEAAETATRSG